MSSFFESVVAIQAPFNMVVMVVLILSVAGVIGAIAKEVRRYLCHRAEIELKREMLDRGMKSHDIEQIMQAKMADAK